VSDHKFAQYPWAHKIPYALHWYDHKRKDAGEVQLF
jgi:hypothetical protein